MEDKELEGFQPKGEPIVSFPIQIKHSAIIPFAKDMDKILCENDHKGGWRDCPITYLRSRLVEEVGEYFALVANNEARGKEAQRELIDIANFCMMLWDRA